MTVKDYISHIDVIDGPRPWPVTIEMNVPFVIAA